MSLFDDDIQERTEQATPKRLKDAKEKGQVARSKDFTTMACLLFGGLALCFFGQYSYAHIDSLFKQSFSFDMSILAEPNALQLVLKKSFVKGMMIITPFIIFVFCAGVLSSIVVGGWTFTGANVGLKFERLDPIKGLFKIFSGKSLMELVKSTLKLLLVVVAAVIVTYYFYRKILILSSIDLNLGIYHSFNIVLGAFFILLCALILVCALDVPYQIWSYKKQLMMTRQEIKEEYSDAEGKPEVKSKLSRMQKELLKRRMITDVPKADVIITNPTHFAVALRYDESKMKAPQLVAKGADLVAQNIIEIGRKHAVPLVSIPPLARTIFFHTEVGEEIPSSLYMAVAKVLAYVFQLKQYRRGKATRPKLPREFEIPPEMVR